MISFCTFAEHDDIPDTELTPWIGFVYTFPAFRGESTLVYQMKIAHKDYSDIMGKTVKGTIDRPLGTDKPVQTFKGKIIGVYHRLNDVEDKWIVALDDRPYTDQEILKAISFQEQYFMGELYR